MSCIAYIFARGGSKGLPGKNVRKLGGHPLIGRAIRSAQQAEDVDDVVVSTDCEQIASVATDYGALVPSLRPPALAQDNSPEWLAWRHALNKLSPYRPDVFVSVPPTAPLRDSADIDRCVRCLREGPAEAVLTVCEPYRNPYFNQVARDHDGRVGRVIEGPHVERRQDAPEVFDITTVAYALRPSVIESKDKLFDCVLDFITVPPERAIDIDTPLDFAIAAFLEGYLNQNDQGTADEARVPFPKAA